MVRYKMPVLGRIDQAEIMKQPEFQEKLRWTKEYFPKVDLIYSVTGWFMSDDYVRVIRAYRDPVMARALADFFDSVTSTWPEMLWRYVGVGVTDEMRAEYAAFSGRTNNSVSSRTVCRVGPGGLHPKALAKMYGWVSAQHLAYDHIPHLFRVWILDLAARGLGAEKVNTILDAYIAGNRPALLNAISDAMQGMQHAGGTAAADLNKIVQMMRHKAQGKTL